MDDILGLLSNNFSVDNSGNAATSAHPRFSQFKNTSKCEAKQNERRAEAIRTQKKKRHDLYNAFRDAFESSEPEHTNKPTSDANVSVTSSVDCAQQGDSSFSSESHRRDSSGSTKRNSTDSSKKHVKPNKYRDQLMLSEWLTELPENFEEDWTLIPCPAGKRCLLVAQYGRTTAYSRTGHFLVEFDAAPFPGGSRSAQRSALTLIDAFYCAVQRRFYLLDVLCWNNMPLFESDYEMRRFWLTRKLMESGDSRQPKDLALQQKTKAGMDIDPQPSTSVLPQDRTIVSCGSYSVEVLSTYSCRRADLERAISMRHFEEPIELDGLLFLFNKGHYVAGVTPFACWLHAWMMIEFFELDKSLLHPDYLAKVPAEHRSAFGIVAVPDANFASVHSDSIEDHKPDGDCCAMEGTEAPRSPGLAGLNSLLHANAQSARRNWENKAHGIHRNDLAEATQ